MCVCVCVCLCMCVHGCIHVSTHDLQGAMCNMYQIPTSRHDHWRRCYRSPASCHLFSIRSTCLQARFVALLYAALSVSTTNPAANICIAPGCTWPKFVEGTKVHEYCSKRCSQSGPQGTLQVYVINIACDLSCVQSFILLSVVMYMV